jgi:hypothetical protein
MKRFTGHKMLIEGVKFSICRNYFYANLLAKSYYIQDVPKKFIHIAHRYLLKRVYIFWHPLYIHIYVSL